MKKKEKVIVAICDIFSVACDILVYTGFIVITVAMVSMGIILWNTCITAKAATEDPEPYYSSAREVYNEIAEKDTDGYYYEAFWADDLFKEQHYINYTGIRIPKKDGYIPLVYYQDGGTMKVISFRIFDKSAGDFVDVNTSPIGYEIIEPYHKEGIYTFESLGRRYPLINYYSFLDSTNRESTIVDFCGDLYIFDSEASARAYCLNGDRTGIIQQPSGDYSKRHDFSGDTYDAEMPVPQLSHISHNGFTVNNASEDLYLDIIVESKFYGVEHNETTTTDDLGLTNAIKGYEINKSWVYGSHYYNLSERSHIAVNSSKINIKELYGVDNEAALISDFKKWSTEYPTHNKLPDYNFWKHQSAVWEANYGMDCIWNDSGTNAQLKKSKQAETIYYVRFYDKSMKYGRWLAYTFRGTGVGIACDPVIQTGIVEPDHEGNPTIPDPETGIQDPDGNISYGGSGNSTIDTSDLWATVKSLVVSMGEVPDLIGHVFSFLPSWLLIMMEFGIAALIILRFAGR